MGTKLSDKGEQWLRLTRLSRFAEEGDDRDAKVRRIIEQLETDVPEELLDKVLQVLDSSTGYGEDAATSPERDSTITRLSRLGIDESILKTCSDDALAEWARSLTDGNDAASGYGEQDALAKGTMGLLKTGDKAADDEAAKVARHHERNVQKFSEYGTSRGELVRAFRSERTRKPNLTAEQFLDAPRTGGRTVAQQSTRGRGVDTAAEARKVEKHYESFAETFSRLGTSKEELVKAFKSSAARTPGLTCEDYLAAARSGR
jgi:hypothetical protein